LILVQNRGLRHATPEILEQLNAGELADPSKYYFRSTPTFESGENSYAWINRIIAVCSGARPPTEVLLDFYEVLQAGGYQRMGTTTSRLTVSVLSRFRVIGENSGTDVRLSV